jgi:AcrR family transcriptional regulator
MASRKPLSGAPARGRREHRKHLTRRELLAAGRRLFAGKGLYDSRIEDLARQAGIAKGTLYGYFANKEELIEAVVTNGFSELHGHVHRAAQGAVTREDAVGRVIEAHLAFFDENPDLMRVFHQVRGLLKFNRIESRALRQVLRKYLTGLAQVLAVTPSARSARESDGLQVAMLLFGAVSGVTSVRAAMDGAVPPSGGSKALVRALVGMTQVFESPVREGGMRGAKAGGAAVHAKRRAGSIPRTSNSAQRAEPGDRR